MSVVVVVTWSPRDSRMRARVTIGFVRLASLRDAATTAAVDRDRPLSVFVYAGSTGCRRCLSRFRYEYDGGVRRRCSTATSVPVGARSSSRAVQPARCRRREGKKACAVLHYVHPVFQRSATRRWAIQSLRVLSLTRRYLVSMHPSRRNHGFGESGREGTTLQQKVRTTRRCVKEVPLGRPPRPRCDTKWGKN